MTRPKCVLEFNMGFQVIMTVRITIATFWNVRSPSFVDTFLRNIDNPLNKISSYHVRQKLSSRPFTLFCQQTIISVHVIINCVAIFTLLVCYAV